MWIRRTTTGCVGLPGGYTGPGSSRCPSSLAPAGASAPTGFPVPGSVAADLDVIAACVPYCRAVACAQVIVTVPDRHGRWAPHSVGQLATAIPAGAEGWSAEQLVGRESTNLGAH
jgi:hypothetical protein